MRSDPREALLLALRCRCAQLGRLLVAPLLPLWLLLLLLLLLLLVAVRGRMWLALRAAVLVTPAPLRPDLVLPPRLLAAPLPWSSSLTMTTMMPALPLLLLLLLSVRPPPLALCVPPSVPLLVLRTPGSTGTRCMTTARQHLCCRKLT